MVGGRKAIGSAQLREGSAFLQHGSILLGGSQRVVTELTLGAPPPDGAITLGEARGTPVTFEEAAGAVTDAAREWPDGWAEPTREPARTPTAFPAHAERFRDDSWTWRR